MPKEKERLCFALDLKDEDDLIKEYENWHQPENCWPEITSSILQAGITKMEIYRTGNRLLMIMEVEPGFDLPAKTRADRENKKVQEWEEMMSRFQKKLPWAKDNEKWVLMNRIFQLEESGA